LKQQDLRISSLENKPNDFNKRARPSTDCPFVMGSAQPFVFSPPVAPPEAPESTNHATNSGPSLPSFLILLVCLLLVGPAYSCDCSGDGPSYHSGIDSAGLTYHLSLLERFKKTSHQADELFARLQCLKKSILVVYSMREDAPNHPFAHTWGLDEVNINNLGNPVLLFRTDTPSTSPMLPTCKTFQQKRLALLWLIDQHQLGPMCEPFLFCTEPQLTSLQSHIENFLRFGPPAPSTNCTLWGIRKNIYTVAWRTLKTDTELFGHPLSSPFPSFCCDDPAAQWWFGGLFPGHTSPAHSLLTTKYPVSLTATFPTCNESFICHYLRLFQCRLEEDCPFRVLAIIPNAGLKNTMAGKFLQKLHRLGFGRCLGNLGAPFLRLCSLTGELNYGVWVFQNSTAHASWPIDPTTLHLSFKRFFFEPSNKKGPLNLFQQEGKNFPAYNSSDHKTRCLIAHQEFQMNTKHLQSLFAGMVKGKKCPDSWMQCLQLFAPTPSSFPSSCMGDGEDKFFLS